MNDLKFLASCALIILASPFLICLYMEKQEELAADRAATSETAKVAKSYVDASCRQEAFHYDEVTVKVPYEKCETITRKQSKNKQVSTTECWTAYKTKTLYYTKTFIYRCGSESKNITCTSKYDSWSNGRFSCEK